MSAKNVNVSVWVEYRATFRTEIEMTPAEYEKWLADQERMTEEEFVERLEGRAELSMSNLDLDNPEVVEFAAIKE